jgi:hypothetical protein
LKDSHANLKKTTEDDLNAGTNKEAKEIKTKKEAVTGQTEASR